MFRIILLFLTLLILPFRVGAQDVAGNITFLHRGVEQGLSHSTVSGIVQDRYGYIWIATHDGLNRYDGYNFTIYRNSYTDPHTLLNDLVRSLAVDHDGELWVGTQDGLSQYNQTYDYFINYPLQKEGKTFSVYSILPLADRTILVASSAGLYRFMIDEKRFIPLSMPDNSVPKVIYSAKNGIFIGTSGSILKFDPSTNLTVSFLHLPYNVVVNAILEGKAGEIWIGTEGKGLLKYDSTLNKWLSFQSGAQDGSIRSEYVRSLAYDEYSRLWVGTYNGLYIRDADRDYFYSIDSASHNDKGLTQNSIRVIFRDSQGGMWLGTFWGGLNYYHPYCNQFAHIKHIPFQNSISDNLISCIEEDEDNNLWIGTNDGGLNLYNAKTHRYSCYQFSCPSKDELPFKDIKTVYIDKDGKTVYVGMHAGGMIILNRKSGKPVFLNRQNEGLPDNNIYSIIGDGEHHLWIASLDALIHFDKRTCRYEVVSNDLSGKPIKNFLHILMKDRGGRLWAAGENGVGVYNRKPDGLQECKEIILPKILKNSFINCLFQSKDGSVWIGTRKGLFSMEENSGKFTQYTVQNGFPSNVIYGIEEDRFGRLWISSNQGISCFNPVSKSIRNYTVIDGLQSNQFNPGACCHLKDGTMMFGGINGITSFVAENLMDNPYAPEPLITGLMVGNTHIHPGDESGILEKSLMEENTITLKHSQNSFSLSFVVTNYIAGRHNTFAYMLKNYDKNWIIQKDNAPISYAKLPPGKYVFLLKAANNDGKWCSKPISLTIRILPVWYATWWAMMLWAILAVTLLYIIFRILWIRKAMETEIRMERMEKDREKEIGQMKVRFYINMSHELRTPLTLIIAPLQELLDTVTSQWEQNKLTYIQRNAKKLLHMVNQMMDYRRAELGIFELKASVENPYPRVMSDFMNYDNLAKEKEIDYNLISELPMDKKMIFDGNYLDLILNNLLSNAFKYTKNGDSIIVKLWSDEDWLALQVKDTGAGIPESKQEKLFERFYQADSAAMGSGIGLSLVKRLVELHHGKIEFKSKVGEGTEFIIRIPQNRALYAEGEVVDTKDTEAKRDLIYTTNASDVFVDEEFVSEDSGVTSGEGAKKGKLMVVEDNGELRNYMMSGLSDSFEIVEAENGKEALDYLKENDDIDLIISDVMMPVMDGVQLCTFVKQNFKTCHIPFYMLSAKSDIKYQLEGLSTGADDYIPKPFSMAVLKAKIINTLRTRYMVYERFSKTNSIQPEKIATNTLDEEFLTKAIEVIEKNIDNIEFSTEKFASEMNMSRSTLHTKLKAITGQSAIDFIHKIRFNRACQLLDEGKYTVSEISFMVGYNSPSYFTARFKKFIGCLPTEYIRREK